MNQDRVFMSGEGDKGRPKRASEVDGSPYGLHSLMGKEMGHDQKEEKRVPDDPEKKNRYYPGQKSS